MPATGLDLNVVARTARYGVELGYAEKLDPNGLFIKVVDCSNQGLEYGGLGKVRFKVYTEWIDKQLRVRPREAT